MIALKYHISNPDAPNLEKKEADAAFDIRSNCNCVVAPGERMIVKTGLYLELPRNTFGKIESRSGLAAKGIDVCGGVVDSGYRGEVGVILHNTTKQYYQVHPGDRIAQMVVHQLGPVDFQRIESREGLVESDRGDKGFGSSGVQ